MKIDKQIHLSLQLVPLDRDAHVYTKIDAAIEVIQQSGLRYTVGPMETTIEGSYDDVDRAAKKAQQALMDAGSREFLVNIKMHVRVDGDVTLEEKNLNR